MRKPRICFLIPYIGRWPVYTDLFLEGCAYNKLAEVLLCAEVPPTKKLPSNVKHVPMSAKEIWSRLEKVTSLTLASLPGHKLCDFKPFYGLAFADLLSPFEFWGYTDVDLMFGRMDVGLEDKMLDSIDAFSAHARQFVGHFAFLRNLPEVNRLAFEIPQWQELCLSPIAEHVDEERFSDVLKRCPHIRWGRPELLERELQNPFCRHAVTFSNRGRVADMIRSTDVVVTWEHGRLWMERPGHLRTEILYVHFMGIKHPWHWPKGGFLAAGPHVFSRLGYGRIQSLEELKTRRSRWLHGWQSTLLQAKVTGGRVLKKLLPPEAIRALRRKIGI